MPQKKSEPEPEVMTLGKAAPVLVAAGVVDVMRGFFQLFWFFGPALAALYCTVSTSGTLSSWTFGLLGTKTAAVLCTAGAGVIGAAGVEAIAPFGVVMAMAVGLFGFLAIGLWIVMTNRRILKTVENAPLQFAGAFTLGEIPFLGALPVFTVILWRLYSTQIKVEKAAHKKWEEEQAAARRQEQARQTAELMQMQAERVAEKNQQAANEAVYAEAANDEIPEQEERAA